MPKAIPISIKIKQPENNLFQQDYANAVLNKSKLLYTSHVSTISKLTVAEVQ